MTLCFYEIISMVTALLKCQKSKKEVIDLEKIELVGYDKLSNSTNNQIVHFFLDDYKFEVMWNDPLPRIERLKSHKAVLTPNFSIYSEMPIPMKIYNTFRSRWCGAFLQLNGVKVIPTLAWGGPETFWFCFDGIEKKSVVAVSTLGVEMKRICLCKATMKCSGGLNLKK